jgi:sensor histidine kinase regulating citrate/malate metabolism
MTHITLLRLLQNDGVHSETDSGNSPYHERIFLGINLLIVIVVVVSISCYCYIFRSRIDALVRSQREMNAIGFARTVRGNQEAQELSPEEEESPAKRQARLLESFSRNNVTMVRTSK